MQTLTYVHVVEQYTLLDATIATTYGGTLDTPSVTLVDADDFEVYLETLELGEVLQITFNVRVNQNVRPEQVIRSRVETEHTSTGSSFPQDGRIHASTGADYAPATNRVDVTIDRVYITTTIISTSLPETPGLFTNIHEEVVYEVVLTLPEVTMDLDARLSLQLAGTLYRNATVMRLGGSMRDSLLQTGDHVATTDLEIIDFAFGTMYNEYDNTQDQDDEIVLRVVAQVNDAGDVDAGDVRPGIATITADSTSYQDSDSITITEAYITLDVDVDKRFALDAGDVVTYTVTATFTGEATSCIYDATTTLVVDDTLDILSADFGTLASTMNITADKKTVQWFTPLYEYGNLLVFTFQAMVLNKVVPDERDLITDAHVEFDSHRDTLWSERGRVYDYYAMAPELLIDQPVIVFSSINSSLDLTAAGADLAVHESVVVFANVTLPESTTRAVITLSPGAGDFDAWVLQDKRFTVGSRINCTTQPVFADTDAFAHTGNDTVTFDFGVCFNAYDNVEDEGDRLFVYAVFAPVDYRAGVVNGRNISLAAELDYSDQLLHRLNQTAPPDLTFRVVEPNLTTRIDYAAFEPVDAGDVVNFTITVAHNGESTAAAYDLVLVAQVHPDLDILSGDGGSHAATHNISQDLKYITYTLDVLPLSDPVLVVTFDAVVLNSMVPTEVDVVALQNVTYDSHLRESWYELPGRFDERENVSLPVQVADVAIASAVVLSSDDNTVVYDVAVSETYTTAITVTLPELTMNVTVETDFLGDNATWLVDFEYQVGERVVCTVPRPQPQYRDDNGDGVHDGMLLDFGTCENQRDNVADLNDKIVLTTVAAVRDVELAQRGQALLQTANVVYTKDLVSLLDTKASNTLTYTVVEPVVELTMDVLSLDPTDAGDVVRYGLTLAHQPASTGSCYDMTFRAYVHPLLRISAADGGPLGAAHNISDDGMSVTFTLSEFPLATGTMYVAFDAVVLNSVHPDAAGVYASGEVSFDSYLLSIFGETGRNYTLNTTSPEINVAVPGLTLTLFNTSDALTPTYFVTINELYIFRARVRLPEVTTHVQLDIDFAESVAGANASVIAVQRWWVDVGANLACTAQGVAAVPRLQGSTRVVLDLGVCENAYDNARSGADLVDLYAEVHVPDVVANVDGARLPATAHLNFTDSTNAAASVMVNDSASMTIVEPTMSISLTQPSDAFVRRSQVVELHMQMTPSFAHDAEVTVTLPAYLHYVSSRQPGTAVQPLTTTMQAGSAPNSTEIRYSYGSVPEDAVVELIVVTQVDANAPGARALDVQVDLNYDSSPRAGLGRPYSDTAFYRTLYVVLLEMSTSFVTNDPVSVGGDIAIQEEVTFTVDVGVKGPSPLLVTFDLPVNSNTGGALVELVSSSIGMIGGNIDATGGQVLNATTAAASTRTQTVVSFGAVANLVESESLTAADTLSFAVTFIVRDNDTSVASLVQDSMVISASFAQLAVSSDTPLRVVEPLLSTSASIAPDSGADAGDVLRLTYSVWHTPDSSHPAYDLAIVVSMSEGLPLLASSNFLRVSDGRVLGEAADVTNDGLRLVVALADLPLGENATLTVDLRLDNDVTLDTAYAAIVPLVYETRSTAPRRRSDAFATARVLTDSMPAPVFALSGSTGGFGGSSGEVPMFTTGEQVGMSLVLPLREGLLSNLSSQLTFPTYEGQAVLAVVEADVAYTGSQVSVSSQNVVPLSPRAAASSSSSSSSRRRRRDTFSTGDEYVGAEFRFGEVLNLPDNVADANDTIEVALVGEVLDVSSLPPNVSLTLSTGLESDGSSNGAEVTVFLVRPDLNVTMQQGQLDVQTYVEELADGSSNSITYVSVTVAVHHTNESAFDAANVATALTFSGTAQFTSWTDSPVLNNASQPTLVAAFARDASNIEITSVFRVDRALNPRGVELCVDATVDYSTPSARAGGPVASLQSTGSRCSELLFPEPSKSFIETLEGQLVVYIAAAVAFVGTFSEREERAGKGGREGGGKGDRQTVCVFRVLVFDLSCLFPSDDP